MKNKQTGRDQSSLPNQAGAPAEQTKAKLNQTKPNQTKPNQTKPNKRAGSVRRVADSTHGRTRAHNAHVQVHVVALHQRSNLLALIGYRQGLAAPRSQHRHRCSIAAVRPRVKRGRAPPAEALHAAWTTLTTTVLLLLRSRLNFEVRSGLASKMDPSTLVHKGMK